MEPIGQLGYSTKFRCIVSLFAIIAFIVVPIAVYRKEKLCLNASKLRQIKQVKQITFLLVMKLLKRTELI